MYHPSRGGVRGGRDQFKWDDVKVDKHRENYLGHSVKAPVGRWQKGKDLFWYSKDKNSQGLEQDALKAEIQKVKEEEEQLMREALGLAPKRSNQPQGNRLDKHEFSELVKRESTAEDLGRGHAEAAQVHGLGFARAPRRLDISTSLYPGTKEAATETQKTSPKASERVVKPEPVESRRKKRKHDEKRHDKNDEKRHDKNDEKRHDKNDEKRRDKNDEKRHDKNDEKRRDKHDERRREKREERRRDSKYEKRNSRDSDDKRKHRKEKRRHDSDSD